MRASFEAGLPVYAPTRPKAPAATSRHIALARLRLVDGDDGCVSITSLEPRRSVGAAGASLSFKNLRTGESTTTSLDADGMLAGAVILRAAEGDVLAVTSGDLEAGRCTVPVRSRESSAALQLASGAAILRRPPFRGPPSPAEVRQGSVSNCYFAAAMAAVAARTPELVQRAIRAYGDGRLAVTFRDRHWVTREYRDVVVMVEGGDGQAEPSWFSVVERAYARWHGGIEVMGRGGHAGDVLEALCGAPSRYSPIHVGREDEAWAVLGSALASPRAAVATTRAETAQAHYTNSGVVADHSYALLDRVTRGSRRMVALHNPWGASIEVPIVAFCRLFSSLVSAGVSSGAAARPGAEG